jgi:hypothetical protein
LSKVGFKVDRQCAVGPVVSWATLRSNVTNRSRSSRERLSRRRQFGKGAVKGSPEGLSEEGEKQKSEA